MNVIDCINERKSIRAYLDKPIPKEDLKSVLEAGIAAPSSKNAQAWKFVVVDDLLLNLKLRSACYEQNMVGEAPVTLVICATANRQMPIGQMTAPVDCSIALSFMMLRATELGLSTCWLGRVNEKEVREILNLPEDYVVVAVTPLGYANEEGRPKSRKGFDEIVHFNKFE